LRDRVFAGDKSLGVIAAVMSAEEIARDAGYGGEGYSFRTEEL
jgi:hypothetical protein